MPADGVALRRARKHRAGVAGALGQWVGTADLALLDSSDAEGFPGVSETHYELLSAWLPAGERSGTLLELLPRKQPWSLDLQQQAARIGACERMIALLKSPSGEWMPKGLGCGHRLCPVCARAAAARDCGRWLHSLEAASAAGAEHRMWTLTQRADTAPGGVVTEYERRKHGWRGTLAAPGVSGRPVGGESLGESYTRFSGDFRACRWREDLRDGWREALGGYLMGLEWTGRGSDDEPRWHVHVHIMSTTERPVDPALIKHLIRKWCAMTGGETWAQNCKIVQPERIMEVLKYPFKVATLTSAQWVEILAWMRGMNTHRTAGSWHATSRAAHEAPFEGWLAARPVPQRWRRLYYVHREGEGESTVLPYRGSPGVGRVRFALADPSQPSGWETWEGDAEPMAARLRQLDPEVPPETEPGSFDSMFEEA